MFKTNIIYLLDVDDVKYVINFDYPNSSEDYVHRIGRTGRSKQAGIAYTFFSTNNMRQAKDLISILEEAHQVVPEELIEMANMAKNHMSSMYNTFMINHSLKN